MTYSKGPIKPTKIIYICFKMEDKRKYFVRYLRKISHYVETFRVIFGHYIEEEWVRVIVEGFVVQETLGKQTQVLGVRLWNYTKLDNSQ